MLQNDINELEDYSSKKLLSANDCIYTMNMHFNLTSSEWVNTPVTISDYMWLAAGLEPGQIVPPNLSE